MPSQKKILKQKKRELKRRLTEMAILAEKEKRQREWEATHIPEDKLTYLRLKDNIRKQVIEGKLPRDVLYDL